MHKYRITIAYDGTNYGGFQKQPHSPTIQDCLEDSLQTFLRHPTIVTGASRTDAGVHALGQTAHFSTTLSVDENRFLKSANALLPPDIRITEIVEVSPSFHARYDADGKIYHYYAHTGRVIDPFTNLYKTHIPYPLDLALIQEAAPFFIGTHDFTSFANEGVPVKSKVRTIKRLEVIQEGQEIRWIFEGDGFLYKMVRNIVGTLLAVGRKKCKPEELPAIFAAKDRRKAPATAPATGLFLVEVKYLVERAVVEEGGMQIGDKNGVNQSRLQCAETP